jgi:dCMP deaminase
MKWELRYLEMAKLVSTWSKDPSTKVGSVIVDSDNTVISVGFNGLPRRIQDTDQRLNNRDIKLKMIIHAEINAIITAKRPLNGATIYTYPFMSCSQCAGLIIQSGICRHISYKTNNERWKDSFDLALEMFDEARVIVNLLEEK